MRSDRRHVVQLHAVCRSPHVRTRGHAGVRGEDHQEGLDQSPDRTDSQGEGHHSHSEGGHRL